MKKQFIQPALAVAAFDYKAILCHSTMDVDIHDDVEAVTDQWAAERLAQDELRFTL